MSSRGAFVAATFRCFGILVFIAAAAHLYATTLIKQHVLARIEDEGLRSFVAPGYLLDHIVLGVFMLPMAFLMYWSAPALRAGERWAFVMNVSFSLAILSTPFLMFSLVASRETHSPLFALYALIMGLVGVCSCSVLLWARPEFKAA